MSAIFNDIVPESMDVLKKAVKTWGEQSQMDVLIEEMSELTKALIKRRRGPSRKTLLNIYEEVADVIIMLSQLVMIYGGRDEIQRNIDKKIERLAARLKEAEKC